MTKLYANIGVGHENQWEVMRTRLVSAAQCNADAVILTKSTPIEIIPDHKKYVSIKSRWGNKSYLEVANNSEISIDNCAKLYELAEHIGIPIIWSVTDTNAAEWVKDNTPCSQIKIHFDSSNNWDLINYCKNSFAEIMYCYTGKHVEQLLAFYKSKRELATVSLYHTVAKFPAKVEEINLQKINQIKKHLYVNIGYEGRCPDIFPDCAVLFKDIDYIEKYLGDDDSEGAILSPQKFYDFFVNMNQLEVANG